MKSIYPSVILPTAVIIGLCCFQGTQHHASKQTAPLPSENLLASQEVQADSSQRTHIHPAKGLPSSGIPFVTRSLFHLTQWGLEGIGNQLP